MVYMHHILLQHSDLYVRVIYMILDFFHFSPINFQFSVGDSAYIRAENGLYGNTLSMHSKVPDNKNARIWILFKNVNTVQECKCSRAPQTLVKHTFELWIYAAIHFSLDSTGLSWSLKWWEVLNSFKSTHIHRTSWHTLL